MHDCRVFADPVTYYSVEDSPSSNVITIMGSLKGPIPAEVAAAILTV